jgi:uncharacterized protein YutD
MITLQELKTYLIENLDEVEVLELLQLNSEQLVEAYSEIIEDKFDYICMKYGITDEIQ